MVAILLSEAVVSSMATRVVARLQSLFIVLNVGSVYLNFTIFA